jgi:hypothetical protein
LTLMVPIQTDFIERVLWYMQLPQPAVCMLSAC